MSFQCRIGLSIRSVCFNVSSESEGSKARLLQRIQKRTDLQTVGRMDYRIKGRRSAYSGSMNPDELLADEKLHQQSRLERLY